MVEEGGKALCFSSGGPQTTRPSAARPPWTGASAETQIGDNLQFEYGVFVITIEGMLDHPVISAAAIGVVIFAR